MKRLKIITILMFFIISMMVYIPVSKAAALTISTSQSNAKEGDSVTITVNGNGISGRVDLSIESGNGTLDEKSVWVDNSKATTTLTITGENDVRVLATPTDASDSATSAAYTQATSATIKVSKKDTTTQTTNEQNNSNNNNNNSETTATTTETKKSNKANLGNLWLKPKEYDFRGFKFGTLNYNTTVPNNVEEITVDASLAKDSPKAKITSGTGVQKLKVGENKLSVVVTAEDGTTKTYTVNVTREEVKNEENTTNNEIANEAIAEKNEDADLIKLEVEGYTLTPTFTPSVYEYKLDVSKDVKDLNVITEGANHNVSVELVGNTDLQEGENVVTVLVYNQETKKNTTYQIIVNKVNANTEDMNNAMNDAIKKANFIRKILIGIFVFVVVAIIAFIIIRRKFYYDDYEYEDEEEAGADKFEEKLNLDEEEELFNRVNKDVFRKNTEKKKKEEKTQEQEDENDKIIEQKNTKEEDINLKDEKIETNKTRKKGKHF